MCVFGGWLGWLAIFEALAILAKASFWICMCAFSGLIGWLDIHEPLAIFVRQFLSLFNLCMVAFLVDLVDLGFPKFSLFFSPSLVFRICMCAFTSWLGWLDIIDSLAIFSKASFSTFQYVYGRFLWLTWLTCYFQDSRHFCQGLFPNMYGRFCSLTRWLDTLAISRRLIF